MRLRGPVRTIGVALCLTPLAGSDWQQVSRHPSETFPMGQTGGRVDIRVRNDSSLDFDQVRAHFPEGQEMDYGPVPKGGVTDFRVVVRAYRYAGFSVTAGGQAFSLQPMDYLGEVALPAGRYTYALGVDDGRLTVQLEHVK